MGYSHDPTPAGHHTKGGGDACEPHFFPPHRNSPIELMEGQIGVFGAARAFVVPTSGIALWPLFGRRRGKQQGWTAIPLPPFNPFNGTLRMVIGATCPGDHCLGPRGVWRDRGLQRLTRRRWERAWQLPLPRSPAGWLAGLVGKDSFANHAAKRMTFHGRLIRLCTYLHFRFVLRPLTS